MQSLNHKSYHKFYRPGCHHPRVALVQFPIWAKLPLSEVELDQFGPSSHYPKVQLGQFVASSHFPRVELDRSGPCWQCPSGIGSILAMLALSEGGIGPIWAKLALSEGGIGSFLTMLALSEGGIAPIWAQVGTIRGWDWPKVDLM